MKVENPVALRFILQDELYLLKADKAMYESLVIAEPEMENIVNVAPISKEPIPVIKQAEPTAAAPEGKTHPISFNYLGRNQKSFLVLVHYPETEFIDDAHLTALTNIIKRKDLSVDDIAIVNLAKQVNIAYNELLSFFKPSKLLVLGSKALPKGIPQLLLNTPKSLGDVAGLYSFAFGEMMDNVEHKKAFWEQVKAF